LEARPQVKGQKAKVKGQDAEAEESNYRCTQMDADGSKSGNRKSVIWNLESERLETGIPRAAGAKNLSLPPELLPDMLPSLQVSYLGSYMRTLQNTKTDKTNRVSEALPARRLPPG
jgi:hypothetical protein